MDRKHCRKSSIKQKNQSQGEKRLLIKEVWKMDRLEFLKDQQKNGKNFFNQILSLSQSMFIWP